MPPASRKANAESLVQSVLQAESDNALYWTCICLREGHHEQLEDAWIELSARIGAKQVMPYKDTWIMVNRALIQLIQTEKMHISEALQMTSMLFLLYHRQDTNTSSNNQHFSKLRKEILDFFPEGAMLSFAGQQKLGRIIPNIGAQTYAFVHRILAGMSRLIEKEDTINIHRALEYISRKKLNIPLPNVWPAPTTELADKGDPVWFLWGSMLLFFPQNEHVSLLWEIYTSNWKANVKTARAGLLWGVAHMIQTGVNFTWTKEEIAILQKVHKMAPELWASINEVEGDKNADNDDIEPPHQNIEVLSSYVPRIDPRQSRAASSFHNDTYSMKDAPQPSRVLNITTDKNKTQQYNDLGKESIETTRIFKQSKDIESPLSTPTSTIPANETRNIDPRYRWLHYGAERK